MKRTIRKPCPDCGRQVIWMLSARNKEDSQYDLECPYCKKGDQVVIENRLLETYK